MDANAMSAREQFFHATLHEHVLRWREEQAAASDEKRQENQPMKKTA